MKSIIDLLKWIQDNWASIVTVLVLAFGIYERAKKFWNDWKTKTEEDKIKKTYSSLCSLQHNL